MSEQKKCDPISGCDGVRDGVGSWLTRFFWGHQWRYFTEDGHTSALTARFSPGWRIYRTDEQSNEEKLCTCGAWRPINASDGSKPNDALTTDMRFESFLEAQRFVDRYRKGRPSASAVGLLLIAVTAVATTITAITSTCD